MRPLISSILFLIIPFLTLAEEDYILGVGDVLEISVWGHSDLSKKVVIRPDGKISLPLLDDIRAEGLTPSGLDEEITNLLAKHIPEPKVTVIVAEIKSKKIYIVGEVREPGVYPLLGRTTLLEAISMAGGILPNANLRRGTILRPDEGVLKVDFYRLLIRGEIDQNITLMAGDTIFLPDNENNMVYVLGEVVNPGLYPIGEELTLLEAISMAGSTKKGASLRHTEIVRGDLKDPEIIKVNLEEIMRRGRREKDITLLPGDVVYIPKSGVARFNEVINSILPTLRALVLGAEVGDIIRGRE
jgi:polysaccharide export outer membrane protein